MDYKTEMEELGLQTDDFHLPRREEESATINQHGGQEQAVASDCSSTSERGRRAPRASPGSLEPDRIPCKICGDSAVR